jgi:hypothetical protein
VSTKPGQLQYTPQLLAEGHGYSSSQNLPLVDLTNGNSLSDDKSFSSVNPEIDHPDLAVAKILTMLAFAVPIGVFALGRGIWWVAMGFKS